MNFKTSIELNKKCRELRELKNLRKELDKEIKQHETELKEQLSVLKTEEIFTSEFHIKIQKISRSSLDSKSLKAELPEIYSKYIKQAEYTRLDIR